MSGVITATVPSGRSVVSLWHCSKAMDSTAELMCAESPSPEEGENAYYIWDPSLPKPPDGFPQSEENGLTLSHDEARWLQERILTTWAGTMLAHVVGSAMSPEPKSWAPWVDPACRSAEANQAPLQGSPNSSRSTSGPDNAGLATPEPQPQPHLRDRPPRRAQR